MPNGEDEVSVLQERSQKLFTATLTILGLLFGGGLLGLVTAPTVDRRIIILYAAAAVMGILAGIAGLAAVNWESMAARTRTLYVIQIAALIGLFLCLLGVAGILVYSGLEHAGASRGQDSPKKSSVPNAEDVEPTDATASRYSPKQQDNEGNYFTYEPENAVDGVDNTAWRVPGDGIKEWIQVNYIDPVKVRAVGIIPGHDKIDPVGGTDRFYQLYVVRRAKIEFSDGTTMEAGFERDRSMQFAYLDSPKITASVRIEVLDTYPPGDNPSGETYPYLVHETAISEIAIK